MPLPRACFPLIMTELERERLWKEEFNTSGRAWMLKLIDLLKQARSAWFPTLPPRGGPSSPMTSRSKTRLAGNSSRMKPLPVLMPELAMRLESLPAFGLEEVESALRTFAAEKGVKAGLLINAARALLTGKAVAPGIFEVMVALGQDRTVARLAGRSWMENKPRAGK